MAPPEARSHLRALDGLRALSVLWVVLFHAAWYARFAIPPAAWFGLVFARWMLPVWRGDFGVDVFFVLSGFLIAGLLEDEERRAGSVGLGLFYIRRLLRLWPALLVVVVLEQWTDDPHRKMAWATALYLNDFLPIGAVALGWTWSLAIEEQFYLVCPWLLRAVGALETRVRVAILGALMLGLIGVAIDVVVQNGIRPSDAEVVGSVDMIRWGFAFDVFYDKPWMRAGALLAGVAAALLYREPRVMATLARGGVVTGALVAAALALMALATHWQIVDGASRAVQVVYLAAFRTVFAVAAAFVLLVTLSGHPVGRLMALPLSSRWLYPVSQLAYSAYLVNPMVTMGLGNLLRPRLAHLAQPMSLLLPCDVGVTFALAAVIHLLVERPGMNLRPKPLPAPSSTTMLES